MLIPQSIVRMSSTRFTSPKTKQSIALACKNLSQLGNFIKSPIQVAITVSFVAELVTNFKSFDSVEAFNSCSDIANVKSGVVDIRVGSDSSEHLVLFWHKSTLFVLTFNANVADGAVEMLYSLGSKITGEMPNPTEHIVGAQFETHTWEHIKNNPKIVKNPNIVPPANSNRQTYLTEYFNFQRCFVCLLIIFESIVDDTFDPSKMDDKLSSADGDPFVFIERRTRLLARLNGDDSASLSSDAEAQLDVGGKRKSTESSSSLDSDNSSEEEEEEEEEADESPVHKDSMQQLQEDLDPDESDESNQGGSSSDVELDGTKYGLDKKTMIAREGELWKSDTVHCWMCRTNLYKVDPKAFPDSFDGTGICASCCNHVSKYGIYRAKPPKTPCSYSLALDSEVEVQFTQAEVNEGRQRFKKACLICRTKDWYHKKRFAGDKKPSNYCILCEAKCKHLAAVMKSNEIKSLNQVEHSDPNIALKFFERLVDYKLKIKDYKALFLELFPNYDESAQPAPKRRKKQMKPKSQKQKEVVTKSSKTTEQRPAETPKKAAAVIESKKSKSVKSVETTTTQQPAEKKRKASKDKAPSAKRSKVKEVSQPTVQRQAVPEPKKTEEVLQNRAKELGRGAFPASKLVLKRKPVVEQPTEAQSNESEPSSSVEPEPSKSVQSEPAKSVEPELDTSENPKPRIVFSDRPNNSVVFGNYTVEWCAKLVEVIFANIECESHRNLSDAVEQAFVTLGCNLEKLELVCKKNQWIQKDCTVFGLAWWVLKLGKLCKTLCDSSYQVPTFISSIKSIKSSVRNLREESKSGVVAGRNLIGTKLIQTKLGSSLEIIRTVNKDAHEPLLDYLVHLE